MWGFLVLIGFFAVLVYCVGKIMESLKKRKEGG